MKSNPKRSPMKSYKKLQPLLDTLPLTLASKFAKTEEEAKLCIDLAYLITEGSSTPKRFYDSGEARQVLSQRSYDALGEVLTSADKYFSDLRAKRKIWFEPPSSSDDTDDDVPVVKPSKKKQATPSKMKQAATLSASPKKRKEHEIIRKGKGKVRWEVLGKAAGKKIEPATDEGKAAVAAPVLPVADENPLVIEPANFDESDIGRRGPPGFPGWFPKYVMYMETDSGFKKFKVYENYDSGLSSTDSDEKVRDIPMSPNFSETWDLKNMPSF